MTYQKRNGRLTKIETVRRMSIRALVEQKSKMAFSYMMRRLDLTEAKMLAFMGWLHDHKSINYHIEGRNIIFDF